MSEPVQCFMVRPTTKAEVSLRRYAEGSGCGSTPGRYHNVSVHVRFEELSIDEPESGRLAGGEFPKTDQRWPAQCGCGYVFTFEDRWQVNRVRIYRADDGREFVVAYLGVQVPRVPPGAMWDIVEVLKKYGWHSDCVGPDGRSLHVETPAGEWWIDGPARDGGHWTRSGEPPRISVSPSIAIGEPMRYHAHLRDGVLVPC